MKKFTKSALVRVFIFLGAIYLLNLWNTATLLSIVGKVREPDATTRVFNDELHVTPPPQLVKELISCKFPKMDPWDKTIQRYIKHPHGFNCSKLQSDDLAYIDNYGYLHMNQTAHAAVQSKLKQYVTCAYAFIHQKDLSTNTRTEYKTLQPGESVGMLTDVVEVLCYTESKPTTPDKSVYYNLLPYPSNQSTLLENFLPSTDEHLSVLMMMFDSTSLSMMRRNLPKMFAYLTNEMRAYVFNGYTKVSDDSFPNLIPILFGKRARTEQPDMSMEIDGNSERLNYRHQDFILNQFAAKSYVTAFNEDEPHMGLYQSLHSGFGKKPPHHTFRPFWLQLPLSNLYDKSTSYCFGNHPIVSYQLDMMKQFVIKYKKYRQFAYTAFTELSQLIAEDTELADELYLNFFRDLHQGGYFEHTAVVVFSNHGHRRSDIRQTLVGLMEERMPVLAIAFPEKLITSFPSIAVNLHRNQNKLTSNFDLHETLLDILHANYAGKQRQGKRSLSHLYPIPARRTCNEAGIPDFFCLCEESTPISTDNSVVEGAALEIVRHLNILLKDHSDKCAKLAHAETLHAQVFGVNKMVAYGVKQRQEADKYGKEMTPNDEDIKSVRVAVEVAPSGARFEALVHVKHGTTRSYYIDDTVSRINGYDDQSDCMMQQPELRKYCLCNDWLEKAFSHSAAKRKRTKHTDTH